VTPSPGAAPTVIVARRVLPGREDEFVAWHECIEAAARSQPGYISSELQHPDSAHPGEWVTVYSFEDAEHLDAWLASDARMEIVTAAKGLLAGPIREQRCGRCRSPSP
jgi:antibiotic biosynthesis monooxygenase (ABM) superfamily enzyme